MYIGYCKISVNSWGIIYAENLFVETQLYTLHTVSFYYESKGELPIYETDVLFVRSSFAEFNITLEKVKQNPTKLRTQRFCNNSKLFFKICRTRTRISQKSQIISWIPIKRRPQTGSIMSFLNTWTFVRSTGARQAITRRARDGWAVVSTTGLTTSAINSV